MIPEKILDRYIKVRRLAQRGADGEKIAAQRLLDKMQRDHPKIEEEADTWERLTEGDLDEEPQTPYDEPPHWSEVYQEQQREAQNAAWKAKFSEWGKAATSAFSWAAGMASHAFSSHEAKLLANQDDYTRLQVRYNKSGSMTMNIKLSPETYEYVRGLSEEQKAIYCNNVAHRVASDLYAYLH